MYTSALLLGAVCRLYFDIEFNLDVNPHTPPIPVLNTFIEVNVNSIDITGALCHPILQYVCYQLNVSFELKCDRSHVVDLDSSNEKKFSRHLIFHLSNAVFSNNIQAGTAHSGGCFFAADTIIVC